MLRDWLTPRGFWEGTASDLLTHLDEYAGEKVAKKKEWPKKPNVLSNALRRLAPTLRMTGIDVAFDKATDKSRQRIIRLIAKSQPAGNDDRDLEII